MSDSARVISVLGGYGISPADNAPPNTYFYFAGAVFYPALYDWISTQTGVKKIAYIHGPDAASQGVKRASKTLRNLDWFEVIEMRGRIQSGKVAQYQVKIKVGFRLED